MTRKIPAGTPVLAVDIGGTKMLLAVFDNSGSMLASKAYPTLAQEGVDAVAGRLCQAVNNLLAENGLEPSHLGGICVACAGGIDTGRGVVVTPSPHLPDWKNIPLAQILKQRFGVPCWLINDASAAALGEHRYGAGTGVNDIVLLTLGTGIGGGIITDGKLYLGALGAAGELGHMTVDADGPVCGCGNRGCLEMLVSGKAIAREAVKRLQQGQPTILAEMSGGKMEAVTAEMVEAAARQGDALANDIIAQAAYWLGVGMVSLVNIFNPEMIILGGGMAGMGGILIEPGRRMVAERAFSISSGAVRIVTARLGNEAGVYGAASFARDMIKGGQHEST